MKSPRVRLLQLLELTVGAREEGVNDGQFVRVVQRATGNGPPDPWCASYVSLIGALATHGQWPLPMTASCDVILQHAIKHGLIVKEPAPADLFLVLKSPSDAIHVGFVTSVTPTEIGTIEGNSNNEGGREGYGVVRRTRPRSSSLAYIRWSIGAP